MSGAISGGFRTLREPDARVRDLHCSRRPLACLRAIADAYGMGTAPVSSDRVISNDAGFGVFP